MVEGGARKVESNLKEKWTGVSAILSFCLRHFHHAFVHVNSYINAWPFFSFLQELYQKTFVDVSKDGTCQGTNVNFARRGLLVQVSGGFASSAWLPFQCQWTQLHFAKDFLLHQGLSGKGGLI